MSLLRATSHIAICEVAGLGMAGRLIPSSLMLLVAMRRLDRRNDLGAVVVEALIDGEEVEDAVVDAGGEDDIVDDGRGKRVTGRAEKLVGLGAGEPQREKAGTGSVANVGVLPVPMLPISNWGLKTAHAGHHVDRCSVAYLSISFLSSRNGITPTWTTPLSSLHGS